MAKKLYEESKIIAIANAIRKKGGVGTWTTAEMPNAIKNLPDEGGLLNNFIFDSVEKVTLKNCDDIPSYAFYGKKNLKEVEFPDSNTRISSADGAIGAYAFYGCSKIKKIYIPGCYTYIYNFAFANCAELEEVILDEGVKTLQGNLFNGNTKLTSITLPNTLKSIGSNTFNSSYIEELYIPDSCTSISDLSYMNAIKSIRLPNGITSIPSLQGNTTLETITNWPETTTIYQNTFTKCIKLKIEIPSTVTTINQYAFGEYSDYGTTFEYPIYIPNTVTTINSNAFKNVYGVLNCGFSQGAVGGAPWGFKGTINYDVPAPTE